MYILLIQKHKTAHYGHHSPVPYILLNISSFQVECTIEEVLGELTETNSVRVNYDKTQITACRLLHREVKRSLKVSWNGVDVGNTAQPKYLGVTFDRTLSYKQHIQNTKMKIATRNNLLKKLVSSKWRINTRTTALAMCYSTA